MLPYLSDTQEINLMLEDRQSRSGTVCTDVQSYLRNTMSDEGINPPPQKKKKKMKSKMKILLSVEIFTIFTQIIYHSSFNDPDRMTS